jgi:protocatechuate 3,4-dioxygenase beta subunit
VLTTQLYFPDEPANDSDDIFDPLLLVDLGPERGGVTPARFDFVLQA